MTFRELLLAPPYGFSNRNVSANVRRIDASLAANRHEHARTARRLQGFDL